MKGSAMRFLFGAANQNRTGDLILTKDVLYHLSHSSIWRPGTGSNRRPLAWQASVLTSWTTGPYFAIEHPTDRRRCFCNVDYYNGNSGFCQVLFSFFFEENLYKTCYFLDGYFSSKIHPLMPDSPRKIVDIPFIIIPDYKEHKNWGTTWIYAFFSDILFTVSKCIGITYFVTLFLKNTLKKQDGCKC